MDGNQRWAKQFVFLWQSAIPMERGARDIVQACTDLGVRYLTFFAFSAENLQYPEGEVSGLLDLLAFNLKKK